MPIRHRLAFRLVIVVGTLILAGVLGGAAAAIAVGGSTVALPAAIATSLPLVPIALVSAYWAHRLRLRARARRLAFSRAHMLAASLVTASMLAFIFAIGWAQDSVPTLALAGFALFAVLQLAGNSILWRSYRVRERDLPLLDQPQPSPLSTPAARPLRVTICIGAALCWCAIFLLAWRQYLLGGILGFAGIVCAGTFLLLYRRLVMTDDRAAFQVTSPD
jgi:hypothetical protein